MVGRIPESDKFGREKSRRHDTERRVQDLERFDGSQYLRLYEKMVALIANLSTTVTTLVNQIVPTITYNRADVDYRIANPGNVNSSGSISAAGSIGASGTVSGGAFTTNGGAYVGGVISSPGTRVNPISTFRTVVQDDAGNMGYSSSARSTKCNITPAAIDEATFMSIGPKVFQMIRDVEDETIGPDLAPWQYGFIADDFVDAGLSEFAFFNPETGDVEGLNYDRLVVPLWIQVQRLTHDRDMDRERISTLERQISALLGAENGE